MSQTAAHKRYLRVGVLLMVTGTVLSLAAAFAVHLIGLPKVNSFGVELYPAVPRGWLPNLIAQILSLTGVLIAMAGATLAFLYKREMTWARATIGAFLFTALMMILFGVIPNEFLTLTQSTLDWSGLKEWITIPKPLVFGNDVSISAAAIKDLIGQGYVVTLTAGILIFML
ncbi:MAG: hypothetical protein HKN91_08255, partial [Acidimicrobiia bacterium]|nr:hypothetical protein [Acidimicrobiia bacterium]